MYALQQFNDLLAPEFKNVNLFPSALQSQIEATNEWTYNDINNGVYKSGFATTQEAYEKAVKTLFASLDKVEKHLSEVTDGPFYYGKEVTEADVRLFTTIVRFDVVYVQHFKVFAPPLPPLPSPRYSIFLSFLKDILIHPPTRPTSAPSAPTTPTPTNGSVTSTGRSQPSKTRPSSRISRTTTQRATHRLIRSVLRRWDRNRRF